MPEGRLEHFVIFSNFSVDFRRLPKISKYFLKFRKLVGIFVFALFSAFS